MKLSVLCYVSVLALHMLSLLPYGKNKLSEGNTYQVSDVQRFPGFVKARVTLIKLLQV